MLYRRSYLFRLATETPAFLWSGFGPLPVPGDDLDPEGQIYLGAGDLIQIPALKQLINGVADRVDFTLSGVSTESLRLALEERESVRGSSVHIGYVTFDEQWQIEGPPTWEWFGTADILTVDRPRSDGDVTRSITLSVASADTRRSNPVLAFWTDADQRRRSPTDAICDHVAGITAGSTRRWGPK